MGSFIRHGRRTIPFILILVFASLQGGCALVGAPTVSTKKLIRYQSMIDLSGLKPMQTMEPVRVKIAAPAGWEALPVYKGAMYTHQQWRSPTHRDGVGVVYARMPFPFSASTVAWLARREYTKRADDGKIIGEWTDGLGRPWFEVENQKFHVRGYVVTDGLDAWIVYAGYRLFETPEPDEIAIASRALESIVPIPRSEEIPVENPKPQTQIAKQ
jgi:hypothetical protein